MNVSDILADLVAREKRVPPGLVHAGTGPLVSEEDLGRWAASTGLGPENVLDQLALAIARDYDNGDLSFEQCDLLINELYSCVLRAGAAIPELFRAVFGAFDEGEYFHDEDRSKDPEQIYTRPQIREVLRRAYDG